MSGAHARPRHNTRGRRSSVVDSSMGVFIAVCTVVAIAEQISVPRSRRILL